MRPGPDPPPDPDGVTVPEAGALALSAGACPLPDYRPVRRRGRGGFGEVWEALGPGGHHVALKFIRLAGRGAAAELRALDLMKQVRHPHLLSIFGTWQRDGLLIIAMELADRSLADRLADGPVPTEDLLRWMAEAAQALDHLNEPRHPSPSGALVGIQHKDVKPQNLLLVGGGVKVADFGMARVLEATAATVTAACTLAYTAPEFLRGKATRWSDQYSLAVTYCHLRGGRLPFVGPPQTVMYGHVHEPPDLTMLPEAERPAVARALSKAPEQRWPSCAAFAAALTEAARRAAENRPTRVLPPPAPMRPPAGAETLPRPARRVWSPTRRGALATAGAALLGGGAWIAYRLSSCAGGGGAPDEAAPGPVNPGPTPPRPRSGVIENSVGMRLCPIAPGRFLMGSPSGEPERLPDEEQHPVTLTRAFHMAAHQVTQAQWRAVMGSLPWCQNRGDDLPVENVSFGDCLAFLRRLGEKEGRRYDLPTEAEWEYACRAGTTTAFHFGDSASTDLANYNGDYVYGPDGKKGVNRMRTTPVGSFPPNAWGLCDMHGNVWEWCAGWYGDYPKGEATDPTGPDRGEMRISRGGSWINEPRICRSAVRGKGGEQGGINLGLRVVLRG
jgi:formylglycine-generating enzyme required for sulfatase activity